MKKVIYSISALLVLTFCGVQSAYSQGDIVYGGSVLNTSIFSPFDVLQMSQVNYGWSTARSSAMGGAMTSLGGDLSSININPAGLGMFRSMNFGFTTDWNVVNSRSDFDHSNTGKVRFSLNNLGVAIPVEEGTGALTSVVFGMSYNRLADFSRRGSMTLEPGSGTIVDIFTAQLNGLFPYMSGGTWDGINARDLEDYPFENRNIFVDEWGAVLGYLTYLNEPTGPNASTYFRNGISNSAVIRPTVWYRTKGYVNEYSTALGLNFRNKLYLGFTFAFQDILLQKEVFLREEYENNTSGDLSQSFRQMTYGQYSKMSGVGINLKVGAIYRPIPELRIGVAYHSPTWVNDFNHDYMAQMETFRLNNDRHSARSNMAWNDYRFNTPSRLQTGVSYTFANRAIVSVDYEAVWYKSIKQRVSGLNRDAFHNFAKDNFVTAHNIRAGVEFKVIPDLALRAGYAYYGDVLQGTDSSLLYMATNRTQNISGGVGYRITDHISIDLAYVYMVQQLKDYELYYLKGNNILMDNGMAQAVEITTSSAVTGPKYINHVISLSMNFIF